MPMADFPVQSRVFQHSSLFPDHSCYFFTVLFDKRSDLCGNRMIDIFERLVSLVQMPFDRQRHGAYADGP